MNFVNNDRDIGLRAMASFLMGCVQMSARKAEEKGQKHGRKTALLILFSTEDLYNKLIQQDGKCTISKIPFPIMLCKTHYLSARKFFGVNRLLIPSVDRIDSKLPYTLDNIQIVIRFINIGKTNCSQDELNETMNLINNPPKKSIIYKTEIKIKQNKNIKEMNTKNLSKELLIFLLNTGEVEMAEKYFMERIKKDEPKQEVKTTPMKKEKRTLSPDERKEWFENNRKFVDECEFRKIDLHSISNMSRNSKGELDVHSLFKSKVSTNVISNNIQIYAEPRGRGYEYFIEKKDVHHLK